MSQDDLNVVNGSGATVRAKINTALQAQATRQAGTGAPAPSYPNQDWADTTTNTLWRRNNTNTAWINCGPLTAALLTAADADVMGGTEATKALTSALVADLWKKGAAIASAASLAFAGLTGQFFHVTGTTTVAGFVGRTNGPPVVLVFDGSLTLTNSASFKLPGGTNIVTAAGDMGQFSNDGADNWVCTAFTRAAVSAPVYTGCRLDFTSSTVITLSRYNGYLLTIDNTPQPIPAAGVTLAPTGLTINTGYFIYAYMSAGVMTLEASLTSYATDARNGMKIKTGDATRSLVGWAWVSSGSNWTGGSATFIGYKSYYNRLQAALQIAISTSTGSTTPTPLSSSLYYFGWFGEVAFWSYQGQTYNSAAGGYDSWQANTRQNGTSTWNVTGDAAHAHSAGANYQNNASIAGFVAGQEYLAEVAMLGWVAGNTGTWAGSFYMLITY